MLVVYITAVQSTVFSQYEYAQHYLSFSVLQHKVHQLSYVLSKPYYRLRIICQVH